MSPSTGGQQHYAYVRLYVSAGSSGRSSHSLTADKLTSDEKPPSGSTFMDGWAYIDSKRGQTRAEFSFDWTTPLGDLSRGHRIYWQKQAGTQRDPISVTYSSGGQTFKASGDLSQDRLPTLGEHSLTVSPAQGPTASLPLIGS